jgi:hypothetical protein
MKSFEKEFCISSPFYFLLPVFFRHAQSTPPPSGTLPVCKTLLTGSAVNILSGKVNTLFYNVTYV